MIDSAGLCNWHKKTEEKVETLYPSEYQQWARTTKPDIRIDYKQSPLIIQSPKNNSVFYYSQLHKEKQAISVEVFGGQEDSLQIFYDQNLYDRVERPFVFQLPVEKGNHTCQVVCGQESSTFNFIVK